MSHVVVGYNGTSNSERALRWAAEEARLRRLPLTVCHVWHWPYSLSHIDLEGEAIVRRMGEHVLDQGVTLAQELAPGVEVRKRLEKGNVHAVLVHRGRDAELIVIGSHAPKEMHVGSTALQVPARAERPVVVVRSDATRDGLVVVGVDGSAGADAALALGFEEAVLRGWQLRAVYGYWDPGAAGRDLSLFGDEDRLRQVCGAVLERAVAPWLVKYPRVQVTTSLVMRPPREALFEAAEDATLMVVGARGAGRVERLSLGATSDALLKHAPCTIAVTPTPAV